MKLTMENSLGSYGSRLHHDSIIVMANHLNCLIQITILYQRGILGQIEKGNTNGKEKGIKREPTNAASRGNLPRQLFEHRKDVRFSVWACLQTAQQSQVQISSVLSGATVTRTTPKHPPNDHVSASSTSTSSYAASISFSTFTLSSTTDGSSASSALFEGHGQGQGNGMDDSGNRVFSIQLKMLYRALSNLETKIKQEIYKMGLGQTVGAGFLCLATVEHLETHP
jgi:hypothetical protein